MHQPTLGDLFAQALRRNHDATAIVDGDRTYTYRALAERVGRLLALFAKRGYQPGHRIGLALPMGFEFLSWYMATQIGGLAYCDLPPAMPIETLSSRIAVGGLRTLVIEPRAFIGKMEEFVATIDGEVIAASPFADFDALEEMLSDVTAEPIRCRPSGAFATIGFTGGSTGAPKSEGFSGQAGAALALAIMASVPFPAAPVTVAYRTSGSVMQLGLNQTFIRGGVVVTLPDFDLPAINAAARAHHANNLFLATRTISTLADQPDVAWMRGQMQLIFHGGEPIAPAPLRKAIKKFGQVFVTSYGTSETGGTAAFLLPQDHDPDRPDRLISAGLPLPGVEVEIRDEAGTPQPRGTIGEVVIRSPGQMDCYIDQPERTAATIRDGWVHTGDAGRLDNEGYLTIIDRTAFAVTSEGQTVYPRLVDAHLLEHPAVSIAVTIPLEDPVFGNRICAAVTLRSGMSVSEGDLLRFLAERPEAPKVHHIMIFSHLPQMAGNLKIDRAKVRMALEEALLARLS